MQFAYQFPERTERLALVSSGGLGRSVHGLLRAATLPGSELVLPLLAGRQVLDAGRAVGRALGRVGLQLGQRRGRDRPGSRLARGSGEPRRVRPHASGEHRRRRTAGPGAGPAVPGRGDAAADRVGGARPDHPAGPRSARPRAGAAAAASSCSRPPATSPSSTSPSGSWPRSRTGSRPPSRVSPTRPASAPRSGATPPRSAAPRVRFRGDDFWPVGGLYADGDIAATHDHVRDLGSDRARGPARRCVTACARCWPLRRASEALCDVTGVAADAVTVDALARLQLAATPATAA